MEKLTQENFTQHIIDNYSTLQKNINKARDSIYKFQSQFGFAEIPDITIRCSNANVNAVKFFKKYDINYYDTSFSNTERILMSAVESYISSKANEATRELDLYIKEINEESDKIAKNPMFKIWIKYPRQLKKFFNYQFDTKSHFLTAQKHLSNYNRIAEEITSFDVETDMYKALDHYIPLLYSNLCKIPYNTTEYNKFMITNKLFQVYINNIIITLTKCGLVSEITSIGPKVQEIMMAELKVRKPLIEQEEEQLKLTKTKR